MPTQNTDVSGNPYGITYTAAGQSWKVVKGVDVLGAGAAVFSPFAESKLVNLGSLSGGTFGVYFDLAGGSGASSIVNKDSGEITGGQYGLYVSNFVGPLDISNDGEILGSGQFGIYASGSSDVSVENHGEVTGGVFAIFIAAASAGANGPVIDNYGTARSAQFGIYVSGPASVEAKLINHEDGKIVGDTAAITAYQSFDFKNEGKVEGTVFTSAYADTFINKGKVKGDVQLGAADDTFKNKGTAKAGLVDTQDGNDLVVFGDKKDKLLFDSALNDLTNVDTVKKFGSGKDAIYLDDDIFTSLSPGVLPATQFHLGTSAADADDFIVYDKASGSLYYDQDGNLAGTQVQFAQFDPGTKLKATDFIVGEYTIV